MVAKMISMPSLEVGVYSTTQKKKRKKKQKLKQCKLY